MGKIITALKMFKRKKSKTTSPWANVSSGDRLKSQREKIHNWTKSSSYSKGDAIKHVTGEKKSKHVQRGLDKTGDFIMKVRGDRGEKSFYRQMNKHIHNLPRKSKHGRILERRAEQTKELVSYGKKMAKKGILPKIKA